MDKVDQVASGPRVQRRDKASRAVFDLLDGLNLCQFIRRIAS